MLHETQSITIARDPIRFRIPREAWTHAGFRAWVISAEFPDELKASWVKGEVIIDMSPEAIDTHNSPKTEVTSVLRAVVRDEGLGELYSDGTFFTNEEADVSTEPDLMYASFASIEQGRVRYADKANRPGDRVEVQGQPDLIIEVISDSSKRKDEELLREGYARAGVQEYWIIDARGDEVRFEMLLLEGGEYRPTSRSRAFARSFKLERVRNRVGRWDYRLRTE